jgi:hypothetical protein
MDVIDATLVDRLGAAANGDPEFGIAARFWNAVLRFEMGDSGSFVLRIRDGRVAGTEQLDDVAWHAGASTIVIAAPAEEWGRLLSPLPPPFFQDLWAATKHHGFDVSGDLEGFSQYYPALGRLIDVLRGIVNDG